jgi:hypothetical protein
MLLSLSFIVVVPGAVSPISGWFDKFCCSSRSSNDAICNCANLVVIVLVKVMIDACQFKHVSYMKFYRLFALRDQKTVLYNNTEKLLSMYLIKEHFPFRMNSAQGRKDKGAERIFCLDINESHTKNTSTIFTYLKMSMIVWSFD